MALKFFSTDPRSDRPEPEGGWKPVCKIEDHRWKVRCESGSFSLECVDAHTEEQIADMEPKGTIPGCHLDSEDLIAEFGPFTLRWDTECPKKGYNDSGSHGYNCDCDSWVVVVEREVAVDIDIS